MHDYEKSAEDDVTLKSHLKADDIKHSFMVKEVKQTIHTKENEDVDISWITTICGTICIDNKYEFFFKTKDNGTYNIISDDKINAETKRKNLVNAINGTGDGISHYVFDSMEPSVKTKYSVEHHGVIPFFD
jgi:hypothetical protein